MLLNRFPEWKQWFMSILLVSSPTVAAPSYPAQPKGFFLMMRHGGGCCGGGHLRPGQSPGGIEQRRSAARAGATRSEMKKPAQSIAETRSLRGDGRNIEKMTGGALWTYTKTPPEIDT